MRKRIFRGRGRPPGKRNSSADPRLLEYLASVSMKYEIDSHQFFDSFIEAWKRQESTCGSLSIECRKKTRDNAIFLITDKHTVVAQFSVPKHFLEEKNPLKEFIRKLSSVTSPGHEIESDHYQIKCLRPRMGHLNIKERRDGKVTVIKE
ncbi:MAG: hypothetical protein GWN31_03535 [Candidatus Thorarchaeota archaeon]|nr:hypothetical protein [Candidatus Thorarchaeota archaeon]